MDEATTSWIVAAPLIVIGVLSAAFGWRGAARHLVAMSGWARWRSSALLLPAVGALLVAMGVLFGLGFGLAALGLMYAAAGVAVAAGVVGAVRAMRAGRHRQAAGTAALAAFLLATFALIALGWETATQVVLVAAGGGLLVASIVGAIRRWRSADSAGRRSLLQSVALGMGLSCQAAGQLLPSGQRTLSLVLLILGGLSLLVALGLNVAARRRRRSSSVPGGPSAF